MTSKKTSPEEFNDSPDLFEKMWVKVLLFVLIPGAVFVLISAGIRVSQYGIEHTIVVLCQKQLVSGSTGAMRVTLIDDNAGFFLPERISAVLEKNAKRYPLFDGEVLETGVAVSRNFELPLLKSGPAVMEIQVYFDKQRRVIRKPVSIVGSSPKPRFAVPSDTKPDIIVAKASDGAHFVRVYTEGRGAPSGLSSLLFVQTTDSDGNPVESDYRLALPTFSKKDKKSNVISGRTGRFGLDAFPIQPLDLHYPITVESTEDVGDARGGIDTDIAPDTDSGTDAKDTDSGEDSDGKSEVQKAPQILAPPVVYSGMKVDFASPLVAEGEPIVAKVQQISGGETVYLDVFKGGQWLYSTSGWVGAEGTAEIRFDAPADGVLRIQVTNSPMQFTRNVAVRHVYVMDGAEDYRAAFQMIAAMGKGTTHHDAWLASVSAQLQQEKAPEDINLLTAFALSRLYQGHSELPVLVSSRKEDDAALNAFKATFQTGLMVAILLLGAAVAVLITVIAWQSIKRQQRVTQMIMDDNSADEVLGDDVPDLSVAAKTSRLSQWIQIGTLFLVVISAFFAIGLLVMTLSWV
ncbi:MAG: hypothetical protein JXX29_23490 [Deltaproteobacteria bacterium]|nr:hypothetical protein [Deltaproteobacteria bacterium]MBN2674665.1 hypothetical protein [Deltaproteobacteria bacterium]